MGSGLSRFVAILAVSALPAFSGGIYSQTNLVSDIPGEALFTDPSLVNPWGLSDSATSPWWISDNGTGLSTLYSGTGAKVALTVTVPPPSGGTPPSAPTGQIFNTTSDFSVGGAASNFIFATEDGTISARTTGTTVTLEVDNSGSGAVYKGLALGNNGTANFLYAANFNSGNIDVFNASFAPTTLAGNFTDPTLPSGYAPFNVDNIGGVLYVTYALQDAAKHDDVAGLGNGYVDEFDTNGNFIGRLISNGPLDSPWGLALAPADFGTFSNDLLVGNFGNGMINAFNPSTGVLLGDLTDASGDPIVDQGLWGLAFGNGSGSGATNTLYFTAGIPGTGNVEDHGLFGDIVVTPEPGTVLLTALGLGGLLTLVINSSHFSEPRL
jgi:uncharacterized protein (TIGR03118 family)